MEKFTSIEDIILISQHRPTFIYKHSLTCAGSKRAESAIQSFLQENQACQVYQVTVQSEREQSNRIALHFRVKHETPQLLLIHHGKVALVLNHFEISVSNMKRIVEKAM